MIAENTLRFVVLAGLISLSNQVEGTSDGPAADPDSKPVVLLYPGPKRPNNEVFILLLDPHLELSAVDGKPAQDRAHEYHLAPGFHELNVHYHEWTDSIPTGYKSQPVDWRYQAADVEGRVQLRAGGRGILEYEIYADRILTRLALLGSPNWDGRWLGTVASEDTIEEPISVDVHNGRFDVTLDMGAKGQGMIDERGQMMIRKKGAATFSFFGTRKGDPFQLRGHIGPRTCKITLHRSSREEARRLSFVYASACHSSVKRHRRKITTDYIVAHDLLFVMDGIV